VNSINPGTVGTDRLPELDLVGLAATTVDGVVDEGFVTVELLEVVADGFAFGGLPLRRLEADDFSESGILVTPQIQ
jgi:hypothetical protein